MGFIPMKCPSEIRCSKKIFKRLGNFHRTTLWFSPTPKCLNLGNKLSYILSLLWEGNIAEQHSQFQGLSSNFPIHFFLYWSLTTSVYFLTLSQMFSCKEVGETSNEASGFLLSVAPPHWNNNTWDLSWYAVRFRIVWCSQIQQDPMNCLPWNNVLVFWPQILWFYLRHRLRWHILCI